MKAMTMTWTSSTRFFDKSALVIPHRKYDLLTGKFRNQIDKHEAYLGSPKESWNAREALAEVKLVHFSDWVMPKPWLEASKKQVEAYQLTCRNVYMARQDCTDRDVWLELRKDFSERRLVG
jgi:hypothetical protein